MNILDGLIVILIMFICVSLFSSLIGWVYGLDKIDECEKQHNVYECELVAVPKEIKK
jgi:hypothetical protein